MTNILRGTLRLTYSRDIDCNFKELTKLLNKFHWNLSGNKWKHEIDYFGDNLIYMDTQNESNEVLFPTVYAFKFNDCSIVDKKTGFIKKSALSKTIDKKDKFLNIDYLSEDELVEAFLTVIKKGWIEISADYSDDSDDWNQDKLLIFFDGSSDQLSFGLINDPLIEKISYQQCQEFYSN